MSALPLDSGHDTLEAIVAKANEIAVLPQVVFKITELTGTDDSSSRQMEQAIIVDPGFSAKLLRQANSSFYGLPRRVTSIREAIMYLGVKAVRQIALTVGVFDLFVGKNDEESLRRRGWWRHSLDTAVCARLIAGKFQIANGDEAYTCGLLHYIGKTLLDRHKPADYRFVLEALDDGDTDVSAERFAYGCDHVQVSVAVAHVWKFPEVLIEGLNYVEPCDREHPYGGLRAAVALGSTIARIAVEGKGSDVNAHPLPAWATELLGIGDGAHALIEEGVAAIADNARHSL